MRCTSRPQVITRLTSNYMQHVPPSTTSYNSYLLPPRVHKKGIIIIIINQLHVLNTALQR